MIDKIQKVLFEFHKFHSLPGKIINLWLHNDKKRIRNFEKKQKNQHFSATTKNLKRKTIGTYRFVSGSLGIFFNAV